MRPDLTGPQARPVPIVQSALDKLGKRLDSRPLRRYISHVVETQVGRALLRGSIAEGGVVTVTATGGELVVDYSTMELKGAGTA